LHLTQYLSSLNRPEFDTDKFLKAIGNNPSVPGVIEIAQKLFPSEKRRKQKRDDDDSSHDSDDDDSGSDGDSDEEVDDIYDSEYSPLRHVLFSGRLHCLDEVPTVLCRPLAFQVFYMSGDAVSSERRQRCRLERKLEYFPCSHPLVHFTNVISFHHFRREDPRSKRTPREGAAAASP